MLSLQSRLSHETGLRHKGNLERYIRDIYKKGAQKDKDKAQEARDIAAIDAVSLSTQSIAVQIRCLNWLLVHSAEI